MKKDRHEEYVPKPGWSSDTGISAKCSSCFKWLDFGTRVYWRRIDGIGSEIRCGGCTEKP